MKRLLLVALLVCSKGQAEDLGKISQTYKIAENDLAEVFKMRVAKAVQNGTWAKEMDKQAKKIQAYVDNPTGMRLPTVRNYSARYFDPSITLDQDIVDQNNRVIVSKGTRVNPLDRISYNKALCFFDANDAKQIEWIKSMCLDLVTAKAIAINGPVMKVMEDLDARLFFDQQGILTKKFGIKAVPSMVRQTGNVFVIEEFAL